ncbi:hypothetical protein AND_007078 [Anopheles darlingi]|uniref:Uncharacterized protein n=1 Tax=Anopheles darlingi TaxID=43151 RepID=W5JB87_ANODA|nr:hypothetical protein AND_007078 [Anopheles darlingi]
MCYGIVPTLDPEGYLPAGEGAGNFHRNRNPSRTLQSAVARSVLPQVHYHWSRYLPLIRAPANLTTAVVPGGSTTITTTTTTPTEPTATTTAAITVLNQPNTVSSPSQ